MLVVVNTKNGINLKEIHNGNIHTQIILFDAEHDT